jgi:hypothetical protein
MFKSLLTPRDLAERYHRSMPDRVRNYLKGRGIAAPFIDDHLLGFDGATKRITIPIFGDSKQDVLGFRYMPVPEHGAAVVSEGLPGPEIYGRETVARKPYRVVICEDEFDRLVLESHNFPAVSIIGSPAIFLPSWAALFEGIPDIFVCFHRTFASDAAAKTVQAILARARVARLPSDVGEGGTIRDYFELLHGKRDFEVLLASGSTATPHREPPLPKPLRFATPTLEKRAKQVRKCVRLHDVVFEFMELQASGGRLVGHCPFHDDGSRAFAVYPSTNSYRCSACGVEGDVVKFLMDKESMPADEALDRLESFQVTHEIYGTF